MKFYQEHKVNPFGSCLPLVLQLPVFLSLFYMLRKDLRIDICPGSTRRAVPTRCRRSTRSASQFLFIPDITDKATGAVLVVLLVLYVGSQLVSSLLMLRPRRPNQRLLMLALPFLFVPFIIGFPAGLIIYWITTNFWTSARSSFLRRVIGRNALRVTAPRPSEGGGGGAVAAAAGVSGRRVVCPSGRGRGQQQRPATARRWPRRRRGSRRHRPPPPRARGRKKRFQDGGGRPWPSGSQEEIFRDLLDEGRRGARPRGDGRDHRQRRGARRVRCTARDFLGSSWAATGQLIDAVQQGSQPVSAGWNPEIERRRMFVD